MAEPNEVDKLLVEMLKGKTSEEILGEGGILKGWRSAWWSERSRAR